MYYMNQMLAYNKEHGIELNKYMRKTIQKQMFYYFRIFLTQQCKKYNVELRVIDRFYPSSKLCCKCGNIKKDLKLSDRTYVCECGNNIDRDVNAGINIRDCKIYNIA